jgi:hypothetical protein
LLLLDPHGWQSGGRALGVQLLIRFTDACAWPILFQQRVCRSFFDADPRVCPKGTERLADRGGRLPTAAPAPAAPPALALAVLVDLVGRRCSPHSPRRRWWRRSGRRSGGLAVPRCGSRLDSCDTAESQLRRLWYLAFEPRAHLELRLMRHELVVQRDLDARRVPPLQLRQVFALLIEQVDGHLGRQRHPQGGDIALGDAVVELA